MSLYLIICEFHSLMRYPAIQYESSPHLQEAITASEIFSNISQDEASHYKHSNTLFKLTELYLTIYWRYKGF